LGTFRQDRVCIVDELLADGPVVVVLDGGHDLSDNVPADCEYVRLATERYSAIISQ